MHNFSNSNEFEHSNDCEECCKQVKSHRKTIVKQEMHISGTMGTEVLLAISVLVISLLVGKMQTLNQIFLKLSQELGKFPHHF